MRFRDLTGQKFNRLYVDGFAGYHTYPNGKKRPLWNCTCDCGNKTIVLSNELTTGGTKSCGCLNQEKRSERRFKDLSGQIIGNIEIIERIGILKRNEKTSTPTYLCKCLLCGVLFEQRADYLRSGDVSSCGCMIKKREAEIEKILRENNVLYAVQVNFLGLVNKNNNRMWFDFAIFGQDRNLRCIIEEQGISHVNSENKQNDQIKKDFCKKHNIILEEIWYKENVEERTVQILDKYLHANPVPSIFDEGQTTISYESTRLMKFQRGSAVLLHKAG